MNSTILAEPNPKNKPTGLFQIMAGVVTVPDTELSTPGNLVLKTIPMGDIIRAPLGGRIDKDATPGTQGKPNPHFTGKYRRVYEEEIGQLPNESPIQAAERLEKLAASIRKEVAASEGRLSEPRPKDSIPFIDSVKSAEQQNQGVLQSKDLSGVQDRRDIKDLTQFDKMSLKELQEYAAEEEISLGNAVKLPEVLKIIKEVEQFKVVTPKKK